MKNLKIKDLEPAIEKISQALETDSKITLNDFNFYVTNNVESIDKPDIIKETRNFLQEQEILEIENSEIHSIDKEKYKDIAGLNQKQRPLMEKDFPINAYEGFSKTELAQEYADWLIQECNIRPVWIDQTTIYYRYNKLTKTWEQVEEDLILKKAKKDLEHQFSNHLQRELKNQFKNHYNYIDFEDMGLSSHQILLDNGQILDLETREKSSIEPNDYALNSLNTEYDREAESDGLKEFIERTIDRPEMIDTLQEYLGHCLTWPNNDYEKMLLILGNTDTGKSTLIDVIEHMFGEATITKISFPQLGMERSFHVPKLKDSVLNIDTDMDDKDIRRKSRVKKIVSKEEVFVEPKGKQGFNIRPKANHLVTSNNAPDDAGATDAFYNRFITLTATNRVKEEDKDRNLADKLKSEENMQWLLKWSIEGLERLESQNKFTHDPTEYETKKIWDKFGNSVQKFLAEHVEVDTDKGYNVKTIDLYEAYELWCETELEDKVSRGKFISQASAHPDCTKRKTMDRHGDTGSCFVDIVVDGFEV